MATFPSKSLSSSWKALEEELRNGRLPEDATVLQRFLYDSIEFVAGFKNVGDERPSILEEWLKVLRDLMPKLIEQLLTWDANNIKIGTVLVYLNHLTYHLVETKMTFLEHFKFLAVAMFYLLCTYIHSGGNEDKPDLVPDVAHKTYSLVCAAGQRVQKSPASHNITKRCYELYFLAAACLNLDQTNRNRNGIKTATDFVSAYVDWRSRLKESDSDNDALDVNFTSNLVGVAVRTYTGQPRDMYGDSSLAYFMEIFRLSKWGPGMAEKLFACGGNLFDFEIEGNLLKFSDAPCKVLRALNYKESLKIQAPINHEVKDLVMALLSLSQVFVSSHIENETSAGELEDMLEKDSRYEETVQMIFRYLADSPKPVQPAVANAVFMVTKALPQTDRARSMLEPNTLRLCYHFSSLAVRVMVRELLKVAGRPEQEARVQSKVYELAFACKMRLAFLQQFVAKVHSDIKEMKEIAIYLKPCLTALTHLISQVDKKSLINKQSSLYKQVYKCLECAVFNIGSIGRNLRRNEEYEIAIALLSQLWPVAQVPALISLVTYQDSLAISYRLLGQTDKALGIIRDCAVLDLSLMTEVLVKNLVKIAEQKPNFDFLSFFKMLEKDPESYTEALQRIVNILLAGHQSPSTIAHSQTLLKQLRTQEHIPIDQRAIYTLLLAELIWASEDKTADMTMERCTGEAYHLACEAYQHFALDPSGSLDDYICQAVFLTWEMQNRAACLECIAKMKPHWERKSRKRHLATTATPSEPTTVNTPCEPSEPGLQQQRWAKTGLASDSGFNPISDVDGCIGGDCKKSPGVSAGDEVEGQRSEAKVYANPNMFQVDSDVLMYKARDCLSLWIFWFNKQLQDKVELDSIRVDRSLRFLTRIADLAILCHQVKPAVESLCQARKLAFLFNKTDTVTRATGTLLYCLVTFGLPLSVPPLSTELQQSSNQKSPQSSQESGKAAEHAGDPHTNDDNAVGEDCAGEGVESGASGLSAEDLWFLDQIGIGADCHVLHLASLAFHYLRTAQATKFLNMRTCILERIESMRSKGPLTPNCTLTLCIIHRLTAEFYSSPASQQYGEETVVRKGEHDYELQPYPLESISDSLKYIMTVAAFYLGENFKDPNRGVCPETWRLQHEYLATLKLQGDLYVHNGNMKYARTHFYEGLRVSMSSLLSTWSTIFLSRITEVSQLCVDLEALPQSSILQSAAVVLAYRCRRKCLTQLTLDNSDLCPCVYQPTDWWTLKNIALYHKDFHTTENAGWRDTAPCPWCAEEEGETVRQRLTQPPKKFQLMDEKDETKRLFLLLGRTGSLYMQSVNGYYEPPKPAEGEAGTAAGAEEQVLYESLSTIDVKTVMTEVAPLLLDCERCDFCHQPEMTEARARLLCSHAEICRQEFKGEEFLSAQSFQFALCAASRTAESSVIVQMINSALGEAQLPHLSVTTGDYRKNQKKVLELTVLARLSQLCPYAGDIPTLSLIHREAKDLQGDANSHVLQASAALSIAHQHHKVLRDALALPYVDGGAIHEEIIEYCTVKALSKACYLWWLTLSRNNVCISLNELGDWACEFNKFKLAKGDFRDSNPMVKELLTSVGKWAYLATLHQALECSYDDDFMFDLKENYDNLENLTKAPVLLSDSKTSPLDAAETCFSFSSLAQRLKSVNLESSVNPKNPMMSVFHLPCAKTNPGSARAGFDLDCCRINIPRKKNMGQTGEPGESAPNQWSFFLDNKNKLRTPHDCLQELKEKMDKMDKEARGKRKCKGNNPIFLSSEVQQKVLKADSSKTDDGKIRQPKTSPGIVKNEKRSAKASRRLKLDLSTRRNGRQQSGETKENSEESKRHLNNDTELSRLSPDEPDENPCRCAKSTSRKPQSRPHRQRMKEKAAPECIRDGGKSGPLVDSNSDTLLNTGKLLDRLAPSPTMDNSLRSPPRFTRTPGHRQKSTSTYSSPTLELCEPGAGMSPEHSSLFAPDDLNLESLNSFFQHSSRGLLSPIEIPRGRPQRATRAKAKPTASSNKVKCDEDHTTDAASPQKCEKLDEDLAEKENVIECTPEREIGKSSFPLLTPKSAKPAKKLTSKNAKEECSQPVDKRPALNSRQTSNQKQQTDASKPPAPATSKSKPTRRQAMKSKENIQPTESDPLDSEIEEPTVKKATRASKRGTKKTIPAGSATAAKERSLINSENDQMETKGSINKSPSKRHSEAGLENILTVSDKSPLGPRVVKARKKTGARTKAKAKELAEQALALAGNENSSEQSQCTLLSKELSDIEQEDLNVEPDGAGTAVPRGASETNHEVENEEEIDVENYAHETMPGPAELIPTRLEAEDKPDLQHLYYGPEKLFPTLQFCNTDSISMKKRVLWQALDLMQHFPASFLYGQLCRSLAILTWESSLFRECQFLDDHVEIAAYLTSSMHITFQHMLTRNLRTKLRKTQDKPPRPDINPVESERYRPETEAAVSDEEWIGDDQLQEERHRMATSLKHIAFRGIEIETFKSDLKDLPPDYTVVQLSVVDLDPMKPEDGLCHILVTRLTRDLAPLTVGIPMTRMKLFKVALELFDKQTHSEGNICTDEYWIKRFQQDTVLRALTDFFQLCFMGAHMCLLKGRVKALLEHDELREALSDFATYLVNLVAETFDGYRLDSAVVLALLDCLLLAKASEMEELMRCLWPCDIAHFLVQYFSHFQTQVVQNIPTPANEKPLSSDPGWGLLRGPVVLILDKTLTRLPWESMAELADQTVTRVPSLASLKVLLTMHSEKVANPVEHGVNKHDAVAVVDPEQNLQFSADYLLPYFKKIRGWTCLSQKPPTVSDLKAILTEHSLYVYCGHGWGKQFVGGEDLQSFRAKALAVVMGCYSSKLEYQACVDGDGAPLYFLMAGCPAVMGNLWIVTDKDIDKLTLSMVHRWFSTSSPTSLSACLSVSRRICKMVGLNGFAPVIYGLPIQMVGQAAAQNSSINR